MLTEAVTYAALFRHTAQSINAQHDKVPSPFEQGQILNRCQALVTVTPRNNQVLLIPLISPLSLIQLPPPPPQAHRHILYPRRV